MEEDNQELRAENERLKDILDKKVFEFADDKKQKIKAEAYKECIEKVTNKAELIRVNALDSKWAISQADLDNILKKLVGGNNA